MDAVKEREPGKPGRKPMAADKKRRTFSTRMPPEWFVKFEEQCALRRLSQSAYVEFLTLEDRKKLKLTE